MTAADTRVPGYLGRVLDAGGRPVGTCFQVAPTVLVTTWHVLDAVGAGTVGAVVRVDALAGGTEAFTAETLRVDTVRDLAVLRGRSSLPASVVGFVDTDGVKPDVAIRVTGVSRVDDGGSDLRYVDASGFTRGGTTRNETVPLGRIEASAVVSGMEGAPVLRVDDDRVIGLVSGRYNSVDGWLRDSVWLARVEDLLPLLAGVAEVSALHMFGRDGVDLRLTVAASGMVLSGAGTDVVQPRSVVSGGLADQVNRLRSARLRPAGRDLRPLGSEPVGAAVTRVGRMLADEFMAGAVGKRLGEVLDQAAVTHTPVRLGIRAEQAYAGLPWEAMPLPGATGRPGGLHELVRMYRQVDAAAMPASPGPLRIVVAISSPDTGGGVLLDYERELRSVIAAVTTARASHAHVQVVRFATPQAIYAALAERPAHVLHLSGHGTPGRLVLEHPDGSDWPLTADEFVAAAIPAGRMPKVVVLAACHTAVGPTDADASFAHRLIARGAEAVIGTETSITDRFATRVFARLYGQLADTPDADLVAAVSEARRLVQRELSTSTDAVERALAGLDEWSTVVILSATGRLALLDSTAPTSDVAPVPTRRRQIGDVVGRRREQRRWPAELLAADTAGIVIHGIGGVGKTTIADEICTLVTEHDPQRVVVRVHGETSGAALLTTITTTIRAAIRHGGARGADHTLPGLRIAANGALPWLQRTEALCELVLGQIPTLLVLDNLDVNLVGPVTSPRTLADPELAGVLGTIAARPGRCRMLITSRHPFQLPDHAHRGLRFHQLGPLSFAETLKLAWSLDRLDRLDETELERVWRVVGGHPRSLEYLDALLAVGHARFVDISTRLAGVVRRRLDTVEPDAGADLDAYFGSHTTLDAALAEIATLSADDILLDGLLTDLAHTPAADQLVHGAALYRRFVDTNALLFQIGTPDPELDNRADRIDAKARIEQILTATDLPPGPLDVAGLPPDVRGQLTPLLRRLTPRVPYRYERDVLTVAQACADASLLTVTDDHKVFVHRWTAEALIERQIRNGGSGRLVPAHRQAARYWRWRVDVWPQTPFDDINDLVEAHHHYTAAVSLGHEPSRPDLADTCHRLEVALGRQGRRREALHYCAQAVDLFRELVRMDPDTYRPLLAGLLNNLGTRLGDMGQHPQALGVIEQAVAIWRRLARVEPGRFLPDLASSLNILARSLSDLGRWHEALLPAKQAVKIRRELARADPVFLADLAGSLNNLAVLLSEMGGWREALPVAEQAVEVRRRLAEAAPDTFRPDLAMSLHNLARVLSGLGRRPEALEPARQAVELYRGLAETPGPFVPDLAMSLHNLARVLSGLGRRPEALEPARQAVELYRELVEANPGAFLPDLAKSLTNLGKVLSELGRRTEAQALLDEADRIPGI